MHTWILALVAWLPLAGCTGIWYLDPQGTIECESNTPQAAREIAAIRSSISQRGAFRVLQTNLSVMEATGLRDDTAVQMILSGDYRHEPLSTLSGDFRYEYGGPADNLIIMQPDSRMLGHVQLDLSNPDLSVAQTTETYFLDEGSGDEASVTCRFDYVKNPNPYQEFYFCGPFNSFKRGDYLFESYIPPNEAATYHEQCLITSGVGSDARDGWSWDWPAAHSLPWGPYPEIRYGHHAWTGQSTTESMPVRLSDVYSLSGTYDVEVSTHGPRSFAFTLWVANDGPILSPAPEDLTHLIIIYPEYQSRPGEDRVASNVEIAGAIYDVFRSPRGIPPADDLPPSDSTIELVGRDEPWQGNERGEMNVGAVLKWLADEGYLNQDVVVPALEFGVYVSDGSRQRQSGGKTWVNHYEVDLLRRPGR